MNSCVSRYCVINLHSISNHNILNYWEVLGLKNFRPVSNLSFLSKLLERIVQRRFQAFLDSNDLMPITQSAICIPTFPQHGDGSHQDLQRSGVCGGWWTVVCPLSTRFDSGLRYCGPYSAATLTWVPVWFAWQTDNVLESGSVHICRTEHFASFTAATHRVQLSFFVGFLKDQCLVRDCLFYTCLSLPIKWTNMVSTSIVGTAANHRSAYMCTPMIRSYMYTAIVVSDTTLAAARLEHCITNIGHWMSANRLKLNADKTELLWAGTKHSLSLLGSCRPSLRLGEGTDAASEHVHLLGVTI